VTPGEHISLSSVGILSQNYQVSGSPESEAVQQISTLLTNGAADLTDISKNYMNSSDEAERKQLTSDYLKKYYAIKRNHIEFVVRNASMLAGIYALYQRLPGDEVLFNGEGDIVYYRMVADSVSRTYPESKYLAALQNEVATADGTQKLTNELAEKMANPVGFPPITLPNIYGQKVDLADVVAKNKATLVYFWKSDLKDAAVQNAELKTIYKEYKKLGFEIFQISLDTSKPSWVAAVQNQQLPWFNLCDFRGAACPAYTAYNITSLPATFLINGDGDMVGKDLFGGALVNKLNQMLQ
jgi:peroxiredoxin